MAQPLSGVCGNRVCAGVAQLVEHLICNQSYNTLLSIVCEGE